jgi:hypothetical protein
MFYSKYKPFDLNISSALNQGIQTASYYSTTEEGCWNIFAE